MSKHGTIRRYTLEIEKISRGQFPSFQSISDYLVDHGFEIGSRTLQRDLEQIRYEFGIEIQYDRSKNGYFIDYENSLNTDSFFRFLEIVNTAELLSESLTETKNALNFISFDSSGSLKGIEYLKPLIRATRDHRKISFIHHSFQSGKSRKYTLKPYLIREYHGRWYIVGIPGAFKEFRTFGIDRIENLEVKAETFTPDKNLNPTQLFTQIIGLVFPNKPVEHVVLSFTPAQGNYIKTLPLHTSQKGLVDNAEECRISISVVPNYELIQEILKHGESVKVLEPLWLAEEIKAILKRAFERY